MGADHAWHYYGDQLQSNDAAAHAAVGGLLAYYTDGVRSSSLVRTVPLGLLRLRKAGACWCSYGEMGTTELTSRLVDIHSIIISGALYFLFLTRPLRHFSCCHLSVAPCTAVASHLAVDPSHLRTSQSIEVLHYKLNSRSSSMVQGSNKLAMQAVRLVIWRSFFNRFSPPITPTGALVEVAVGEYVTQRTVPLVCHRSHRGDVSYGAAVGAGVRG